MPIDPRGRLTAEPRFAKLKIIDVDTHYCEPHDFWTSRVAAKYRNLVPRVERIKLGTAQRHQGNPGTMRADEVDAWVVGEDRQFIITAAPTAVIDRTGIKHLSGDYSSLTMETVDPGAYDAKARVAVMDALGIHAQIMYPNITGGSEAFFRSLSPDIKTMCIRIFNDAMVEFQEESGDRIYPMAVLPWWDVDASVKEVERAKTIGLHGIVTTSDPHALGLPHLGQESWHPVWEACEDLEMPVNFHIGGSSVGIQTYTAATWPGAGPETAMSLGSAAVYGDNQRVIGNLIFWGVPERFPRIKIVSVESGVGWLPFYLQALDHQAVETSPNETSFFTMKPSEYFRRNFHCSFWFETEMLKPALDYIGTDNVMFETDYPHPTCIYPDPRSTLTKAVADLSDETVQKLTQDNAARLYRIPL